MNSSQKVERRKSKVESGGETIEIAARGIYTLGCVLCVQNETSLSAGFLSMQTKSSSRREFLKQTAAVTAVAAVPYFLSSPKAFANQDKNDRPQIGCIGTGSMGTGDAHGHARFGDIVACVWTSIRSTPNGPKNDDKIGKGKADAYEDYRKVLDRKDIDVVSIVTPDHWHIKIAIEALQAGKHVFCQKPLTLTIEENQLIRAACEEVRQASHLPGRHATAERCKDKFLRAVNMVQKGLLGDIKKITVGIDGSPTSQVLPVKTPKCRRISTGTCGSARLRRSITVRSAAIMNSAGGTNTPAASSPIGALTTSTSRPGPWANEDKEGQGPIEVDGTDAKHPLPVRQGLSDR
jgi:hypothetical protein